MHLIKVTRRFYDAADDFLGLLIRFSTGVSIIGSASMSTELTRY